jgi:hypothetical protein
MYSDDGRNKMTKTKKVKKRKKIKID